MDRNTLRRRLQARERHGRGRTGDTLGDVLRGQAEYSGPSLAELWDTDETDSLDVTPSELSDSERETLASYSEALHNWIAAGSPKGEAPAIENDETGVTRVENVERWADADVSTSRRPTL